MLDATEPTAFSEIGHLATVAWRVRVVGDRAYLLQSESVVVADFADPRQPQEQGRVPLPAYAVDLAAVDDHVYVVGHGVGPETRHFVVSVDVGNPAQPVVDSIVNPVFELPPGSVALTGRLLLMATGVDGPASALHVLDITDPKAPQALATVEVQAYPLGLAAEGDHAYLLTSRGIHVIDLSRPEAPLESSLIEPGVGGWYALDVEDGFLYLGCGYSGLLVFNVSRPAAPLQIAEVPIEAWDVVVSRGLAFVGGRGERWFLDVSDPHQPVEVRHDSESSYPSQVAVAGGLALLADGDLEILDVTACPTRAPEAGFTWAPLRPEPGQVVAFRDTSRGLTTSVVWDFGDGATSTEQHPRHVFERAGAYRVTLTVGNNAGSDCEEHDLQASPWWRRVSGRLPSPP